jgi:hypothetical protein
MKDNTMFKKIRGLFVPAAPAIISRGRCYTRDVAFNYRMPGGFAGDINRSHPASVEPVLWDVTSPPTFTGQAVVVDSGTHNVRACGVTDDSALTDIYGVAVRVFPIQQSTGGMSASFGVSAPPANQPGDVLKSGYIMVPVSNAGVPVKGGAVFVWAKPNSGAHVQGGFETTATGGSTIALPLNSYSWNGGPDANGIAELIVRA